MNKQQQFNSISSLMDYDMLKEVLPKDPSKWSISDTETWLNFIGLSAVAPVFKQFAIDGSIIQSLTQNDIRDEMLIKSNITIKKLMSWINFGIKQYQDFLLKQNTTSFKGNSTIQIQDKYNKQQKSMTVSQSHYQNKDMDKKQTIENKNDKIELILKQEEIEHENVIHRVGVDGADIGRHTSNKILILDEAVSRYHSKIIYQNNQFMIKDIGSTTGTFLKILNMKKLEQGMLVEMGSYTFLVKQIHGINLTLEVIEVIEGAEQPLVIEVEVEKRITIGRKQTNKISFPDDAHMSNTHACIFPIGNSLFIEDLEATNGTWLRLSAQGHHSDLHPLCDGDFLKVSGGCTYSVRLSNMRKSQKQAKTNCLICETAEKDAVLLPCKHNILCLNCSQQLKQCPYCNIEIQERLKIFG